MGKFFVPYNDNCPAAINIKGHKLLILASTEDELWQGLECVGGNKVREMTFFSDETELIADLAAKVKGGVVLTPPGMSVSAIIKNLEDELPWIH